MGATLKEAHTIFIDLRTEFSELRSGQPCYQGISSPHSKGNRRRNSLVQGGPVTYKFTFSGEVPILQNICRIQKEAEAFAMFLADFRV